MTLQQTFHAIAKTKDETGWKWIDAEPGCEDAILDIAGAGLLMQKAAGRDD